ncbi:Potassium/sodium hyperpolarization-activated cyclic nucleotide-gated channel 2 [Symbiodinium microadriaticum]|uniref:Potassium/sodium hyperpolarization-activated cyclic nucleotide-gated channel 2 n=1 Tax=Symbiodinium microadriaticum TaxID=2951 RepID=A0A1Q9EEI7_SYMMI|nr:Potassium/sodium hyperpolarization-activated cyclic nucleotide-gated channel 2 [Symbiodinium microadriaticum]
MFAQSSEESSYEEILRDQLASLHATLLAQHDAKIQQLKSSNSSLRRQLEAAKNEGTKSNSPEDQAPQDFVSPISPVLSEMNVWFPFEVSTTPMDSDHTEPIYRWENFAQKLMDKCEEAGPTNSSKNLEWGQSFAVASGQLTVKDSDELHMRQVWCASVLDNPKLFFRRKPRVSHANMSSSFRVNDAFTDERSCLQRFVVGPQSKWQLTWSMCSSLLILWDLITIPLEMFSIPSFTAFLDTVGLLSFTFWLMDIPLHFIFGVQLEGMVELRPRVLARMYLRSWFAADVAIVSLDAVLIIMEAIHVADVGGAVFRSARYLRTLRLLRLIRLLRVAKLQRELTLLANRFLSTHAFMVIKVISYLMMMLAINHIIACCWYGLGSWSSIEFGPTKSWIENPELNQEDFAEMYFASLHWALTQFTPATNNIAPLNVFERFFAVVVILLAMGVFSSFVGSISNTVNNIRAARVEQQRKTNKMLQFFIERNLSVDLYGKIHEVLRTEGETEVRLQEKEVNLLQRIPERLKLQLHEEMYMNSLVSMNIWPTWSHTEDYFFFRNLCHNALLEHVCVSGEDAFMPTTQCDEVYVLQFGSMAYLTGRREDLLASRGEVFCLPAIWTEWYHHGRLTAQKGACYYLGINCSEFGKIVISVGGPLYRHLQIFGILLIGQVEDRVEQGLLVTDCLREGGELQDLVARAQRFASLVGADGAPQSLSSLRPSEVTTAPSGKASTDGGPVVQENSDTFKV